MGNLALWTLVSQTQEKFNGSKAKEQATIPAGDYTFFIEQPKGYKAIIKLFDGETQLQMVETPQMPFHFDGHAGMKIQVTFAIALFGKVSVSSDPKGIAFTLTGPHGVSEEGKTPASYENMPIGLYSVRYKPTGCSDTPPQSNELVDAGRVDFSVSIKCDRLEQVEVKQAERDQYVSATIDGQQVYYKDVLADAWYATYVTYVSRRGILTGYRNADGTPSESFGPGNSMTLAELAKIVHSITGLDVSGVTAAPANASARGTWAAPYIASAETNDWLAFINPDTDVMRPATRGEVVATILQALDVPLKWPKGTTFKDVGRRTLYAAEIETAAEQGIVSGTTDEKGFPNGLFNPEGSVARAEMAKIVMKTIEKFSTQFTARSSSSSR